MSLKRILLTLLTLAVATILLLAFNGKVPWLWKGWRSVKVFTKEELKELNYKTDKNGKMKIYIVFLGEVFDVSDGETYYGPGKGYSFFAGHDASRAFVSGIFEGDPIDDTAGLTHREIIALWKWYDFYHDHEVYKFAGVLKGRYFDENGHPTEEYMKVKMKALEPLVEEDQSTNPSNDDDGENDDDESQSDSNEEDEEEVDENEDDNKGEEL